MKIRVKHIITAIAITVTGIIPLQTLAQQSTQAVMDVTARVVNGVQSEIPDSFDLCVLDINEESGFTLGEYKIRIPEGLDYLVSFDGNIDLSDQDKSWKIQASMNEIAVADGTITFAVSGISSTSGVQPGQYQGAQTTRIEYY
jgi:hypothetical protein